MSQKKTTDKNTELKENILELQSKSSFSKANSNKLLAT